MQRWTSHKFIIVVCCSKWISTQSILWIDASELGYQSSRIDQICQNRVWGMRIFTQPLSLETIKL